MAKYGLDNDEDLEFGPDTMDREDINTLKSIVAQYFRIYDIRWNEKTGAFYFNLNKEILEENFEQLRLKLKDMGFVPRISEEKGEHIIYIVPKPKIKRRSIWLNVILIILTLFTTTWAGAILWFSRMDIDSNTLGIIEPLLNFESIIFGFLSFALPLMIILGTHETAHYLSAKRHNIEASLPFFIPLPPPFILGTMGAFISMREPISNKKALLDIGAAGPIAGFLVSIPILIVGFFLESLNPVTITEVSSELYVFNEPLLFAGLRYFFPAPENSMLHPTVFAGWVGLFVTALNLIPGGQLDGGHIARALFGDNAKYMSYFVILVLFTLSIITSSFLWIFFILIILFSGTSHPPPLNDITPLGNKRRAVGAFCMAMLLLCIHYAPISIISAPEHELKFECDNPYQVVDLNGTVEYTIRVINNGENKGEIEFSYYSNSSNSNISDWYTRLDLVNSKGNKIKRLNDFDLESKDFFTIKLTVSPNSRLNYGARINHQFKVVIMDLNKFEKTFDVSTHIGTFDINTLEPKRQAYIGNLARFNITVHNVINQTDNLTLTYNVTNKNEYSNNILKVYLIPNMVILAPYESRILELIIEIPFEAKPGLLKIKIIGTSALESKSYDSLDLTLEIQKSK